MTDPTSNDTYYFNSVTQETSWTRPAALGGKRKDEYRVNECVALWCLVVAEGGGGGHHVCDAL